MANPNKGEVEFKGSDGKTYTLSLSINALCELDEALGVDDVVNKLVATGKVTLKQYRTMFFIALRQHHKDIVDEKAAADLVIVGQMMQLLTKAIMLTNPSEVEANGAGVRPSTEVRSKKSTGLAS